MGEDGIMGIRMTMSEIEEVENKPSKKIRVSHNDLMRFDDDIPTAEKPKPRFFQEVAKGVPRGFENVALLRPWSADCQR